MKKSGMAIEWLKAFLKRVAIGATIGFILGVFLSAGYLSDVFSDTIIRRLLFITGLKNFQLPPIPTVTILTATGMLIAAFYNTPKSK